MEPKPAIAPESPMADRRLFIRSPFYWLFMVVGMVSMYAIGNYFSVNISQKGGSGILIGSFIFSHSVIATVGTGKDFWKCYGWIPLAFGILLLFLTCFIQKLPYHPNMSIFVVFLGIYTMLLPVFVHSLNLLAMKMKRPRWVFFPITDSEIQGKSNN